MRVISHCKVFQDGAGVEDAVRWLILLNGYAVNHAPV